MTRVEADLRKWALWSRLLIIGIETLFNHLIPDHDAKVFNPPILQTTSTADTIVWLFLSGLYRWDAVQFIYIAEHGYIFEHSVAFFPLYPLLIRTFANSFLLPLQLLLSYHSVLLVSAASLNVVMFIQCTVLMYRLSLQVLKDALLSYHSALLFCFNPASIFFSAYYSETLFTLLTLQALLLVEHCYFFRAAVVVGLSALTRSNGFLNLGYIIYRRTEVESSMTSIRDFKLIIQHLCTDWFVYIVLTALSLSSFVLYQWYIYHNFCYEHTIGPIAASLSTYAADQNFVIQGRSVPTWCNDTLPISYTYVQEHYWNVGFMKYYQWKQVPNFILAMPMLVLCIKSIWMYFYKKHFLTLLGTQSDKSESGFLHNDVFVYIVHLTSLTVTGVFFLHVQVVTRFVCSSSPVVMWYVAYMLGKKHCESIDCKHDFKFKIVYVSYFLLYFVVGTAAFCNFLPWT